MLEQVVAAFQTQDLAGFTASELIQRVTGCELPSPWKQWQAGQQVVFVPSPHVGPYLVNLYRTDLQTWYPFRAHPPEGVTLRLPTLTRSELLMRLSALADDTRLRILELLSQHAQLNAQEVMERLELSQSSASRHLSQLSASGYLTVARREGVKSYRLNRDRIDDTLHSLKDFL
jgi:DNA-binding transcriptional ArsR family regulator